MYTQEAIDQYKNLPDFEGFEKTLCEIGVIYTMIKNDQIFVSEDVDGENIWWATSINNDGEIDFSSPSSTLVGAISEARVHQTMMGKNNE